MTPQEILDLERGRAVWRATLSEILAREGKTRAQLLAEIAAPDLKTEESATTPTEPSPDPRRKARALALKGASTREAARHVAEALAAHLGCELPAAMQTLARHVSAWRDLREASPEDILRAWLDLEP